MVAPNRSWFPPEPLWEERTHSWELHMLWSEVFAYSLVCFSRLQIWSDQGTTYCVLFFALHTLISIDRKLGDHTYLTWNNEPSTGAATGHDQRWSRLKARLFLIIRSPQFLLWLLFTHSMTIYRWFLFRPFYGCTYVHSFFPLVTRKIDLFIFSLSLCWFEHLVFLVPFFFVFIHHWLRILVLFGFQFRTRLRGFLWDTHILQV